MSSTQRAYRNIEAEPFAAGDDKTKVWPLRYRGSIVTNVDAAPRIYRTDWQGRVALSDQPRTNYALHSNDFSFNQYHVLPITQHMTGPDGVTTAGLVVVDTGYNPHGIRKVYNMAPNEARRHRIRAKAASYTFCSMWAFVPVTSTASAVFDLVAGTCSGFGNPTIEPLGDGWYLCEQDVVANSSGGAVTTHVGPSPVGSPPAATQNYGGDGVSGIYMFGEEFVDVVGAYIPTTDTSRAFTDYALQFGSQVVLPQPLQGSDGTIKAATLDWSGRLYYDQRSTLLPPNAASGTRALEAASARIGDVDVPLRQLWNPDTCPLDLLPWLAWALSIDAWKSYWPEQVKRDRVRRALDIQRHKGSVKSVRDVVASFGGAVALSEWWQQDPPGDPHTFAMSLTLNGAGGTEATAAYVDDVIAEVERTKPVRSHYTFTQGAYASGRIGVRAVARPVVYRRLSLTADAAA